MSYPVKKHGEVISQDTRSLISKRYKTVTSAVNQMFWGTSSETSNSLYVGSYGRGTAIDTSDVDILIDLPQTEYERYDAQTSNGQSRLLQALKSALLTPYPRSNIRADGQVVKIDFSDGMMFEVLPGFRNWDGTYKYPDTNMGGNWLSTNPKAEQTAMRDKNSNSSSNGLLFDTCMHFRRVHNDYYSSYKLSGIVIDSFVYTAMAGWKWLNVGETSTSATGDYENILLNYYLQNKTWLDYALLAPGSNETLESNSSLVCLEKVLRYIAE
ncbi:MAG: nucleotidyltransferase domain-containing protein [Deltaproteobacteria bacterium]|jgi:predicted nucleotidyltransferase|nr:nucleotidyltransferase domain-containing protein [Deltaproteobacteria bacterium]